MIQNNYQIEFTLTISRLGNFSYHLWQIMIRYDFLEAMWMVLSNDWTDYKLDLICMWIWTQFSLTNVYKYGIKQLSMLCEFAPINIQVWHPTDPTNLHVLKFYSFSQTYLVNWEHGWPDVTVYMLDEWFWAMLELTPTPTQSWTPT